MIQPPDSPEPPTHEELQEARDSAEQLLAEVNHYRDTAQEIDDRYERANEDRRLSLDDMPFGEELIRTRELPNSLNDAIETLERIAEGRVPSADVPQVFQGVLEAIEGAQDTLDDCTSLPAE